jgi:hypothetical protein
MRTKTFSALLLTGALLFEAGTASASLFGISYYDAPGFPSNLYQLNTATGQVTGRRIQGATGLFGIAFSTNGTLYALSARDSFVADALFRIDPVNATATLIGPTGLSHIEKGDIAFDPVTQTLYGLVDIPSSGVMNMFTINPSTGHATTIGSVDTGGFGGLSSLAFDASGNLLILSTNSPGTGINVSRLFKVDKTTAAILSSVDLTGAQLGFSAGMAIDPSTGIAYIADGNFRGTNMLYTLDTSTGVVNKVGPTGTQFRFGVTGLAFSPESTPTPEPGSAWFLVSGGAATLWMKARKGP